MERALVGIGSNLGESVKISREAAKAIASLRGVHSLRHSSLYRTRPVGIEDQPWFVNSVVVLETTIEPGELLATLLLIESRFGRERVSRWGPRTLDLDILGFGSREFQSPELVVPHPRLHERAFVLVPLTEVAPDWIHPKLGVSARELLRRLSKEAGIEGVVRLDDL